MGGFCTRCRRFVNLEICKSLACHLIVIIEELKKT